MLMLMARWQNAIGADRELQRINKGAFLHRRLDHWCR
jgi:hypothetical protein